MGRRKGKITCRKCGMVFSCAEEWAEFEDCANSDCYCPKVKAAMETATTAIQKAKESAKKTTIVRKEHDAPRKLKSTLQNTEDDMVYVEVPTIQSFSVTPLKRK